MFNKFFLIACIIFTSNLYADDSSHKKAAEKLLDVTKTAEILNQTTTQMTNMFAAMSQRPDVTPEQKKIIRVYEQKASGMLKEELNWDKLKDEFISLYATVYTEQELVGLTEFYQTPIGKKMLAKTPELMMKSMQISQKHVQLLVPKMEQLMMQMGKELSVKPQ